MINYEAKAKEILLKQLELLSEVSQGAEPDVIIQCSEAMAKITCQMRWN